MSKTLIIKHQCMLISYKYTVTQLLDCHQQLASFNDRGNSVDVINIYFAEVFDSASHV